MYACVHTYIRDAGSSPQLGGGAQQFIRIYLYGEELHFYGVSDSKIAQGMCPLPSDCIT